MAEERAQIAFPYYQLQATGGNAGVQITAYVSTEGGDPRQPSADEIAAHLRDWLQATGAFSTATARRIDRTQVTL
jgi:hypothetical protein